MNVAYRSQIFRHMKGVYIENWNVVLAHVKICLQYGYTLTLGA